MQLKRRRMPASLWEFSILCAVAFAVLAGCSSAPDEEPTDLVARVYVDLDGNGSFTAGDVPLPGLVVTLDGELSAGSDEDGLICFEDVRLGRHTIVLNSQDVEEMASHSLICSEASKTLQIASGAAVDVCFATKGFMDVDMAEDPQGE